MDFVETQAQATPEVAEDLAALGELFSKKLYHELTTALRTFVQSDAARQRGQLLLDLEEKFLSKVEAKLNQLQYAMILGDLVVGAVDSTVISAQEGIERLKKAVEDKRGRLGAEPSLYLEMEAALLALRGADANALEQVKKALEEAKPTMDGLTGTTDTAVFRKYYAAASDYRKLVGPPEAFYRAALSLLSYASADDMPLNKRRILATDVVHKYGEINNWDVSNVTNMTSIFEDAHFFNQPLNKWNVSNVTNMYRMFDARSRRRAGRAVPRGASERPARGGENCLASSGGGVRAARRV